MKKHSRSYCPSCAKVTPACICHTIHSFNNSTELIILQHPLESKHPLNTAIIAKLSFKNSQLFIGEDFAENQKLQTLLRLKRCALVFPTSDAMAISQVATKNFECLIFIDGTWKKAKKIYYLNQVLQNLPHIHIDQSIDSKYKLRKSPAEDKFSTFEAAVHSLQYFDKMDYTPCLKALDYMMNYQINAMGEKTFFNNYVLNKEEK